MPPFDRQAQVPLDETRHLAQPQMRRFEPQGVIYPEGYETFAEAQRESLDLVAGPHSQRARRRQRQGRSVPYEALGDLIHGGDLAWEIAQEVRAMLDELSPETRAQVAPELAHLRPIPPEAVLRLPSEYQRLVLNPFTGRPPETWLDLDSSVFNSLMYAFRESARADGTIDREHAQKVGGPLCLLALDKAETLWHQRLPIEQHWMAGEVSPFDPDDRAITNEELYRLEREHPLMFQRLMSVAPIPETMPVFEEVARHTKLDLAGRQLFLVQHVLGSLDRLIKELRSRRVSLDALALAPIVYSKSPIVTRKVRDDVGAVFQLAQMQARAPRDIEPVMEVDTFFGLQESFAIARHLRRRMTVIDEGGWVIRLLSGRAKFLAASRLSAQYKKFLEEVRGMPVDILEQTEGGVREALAVIREQGALPAGVNLFPMGRLPAKLAADSSITGLRAIFAVQNEMYQLGLGSLNGKTVCQIGYGNTGRECARHARAAGARVLVVDKDESARARAREDGFHEVFSDREATTPLSVADVTIGSTGELPITLENVRCLKQGAALATTSSKAREFYNEFLRGRDTGVLYPPSGTGMHGEVAVVHPGSQFAPNRTLKIVLDDPADAFNQKTLYLLNGLVPVAFDRQVNDYPPEIAQLVEAIKLRSLSILVGLPPGTGLVELTPEMISSTNEVLQIGDRLRPGWRNEVEPLSDTSSR